jgi:hypothetical protein
MEIPVEAMQPAQNSLILVTYVDRKEVIQDIKLAYGL